MIFQPSSQMFRFLLLTRRLPQRLPTVTPSTVRPKMVLEPNDFVSAVKYREQSTLTTRNPLSRPAPELNDISTQERILHTESDNPENKGEASRMENRKAYTNNHGEEILFRPCYPPRGYEFVPSGNIFITRRCRPLAPKVYEVGKSLLRK